MSTAALPNDVTRPVARRVALLRLLLRLYVVAEGAAAVVIALAVAFWVCLGLDWLFEPSVAVRVVLWSLAAAAIAGTLYRALLSRLFTRVSDESLALLLERRFGDFDESLVTTVEALDQKRPSHFQSALLEATARKAAEGIRRVSLRRVFRARPLLRKTTAALALAASVVAFALLQRDAFGFWMERMQLTPQPWPRTVHLEVVGFEPIDGILTAKVARDADFLLEALASIVDGREAPDRVEIRYRLADGRRGRDTMTRVGEALPGRDESQRYQYEFKAVASDLQFDLYGGDDRIRDLRLQAVDRPTVNKIDVEITPPAYLGGPRQVVQAAGAAAAPEGSRVVVGVEANKRLVDATIRDADAQRDLTAEWSSEDRRRFTVDLGEVRQDQVLLLNMRDIDGIATREPYRVVISAIPDEVPDVSVQLRGIGTAVTPQAILPLAGEVTDDHGIEQLWFDYAVDEGTASQRLLNRQPGGSRQVTELEPLDLAAANPETGQPLLAVVAGQQLSLRLGARDAYNLEEEPHVGSSQRFLLEIVTPSELRGLLERQELALRQRFEAIYEKMVGTRKLLDRVENDIEQQADATISDAQRRRLFERGQARIAGARQNTTQLSFETLGVAAGFDQIVAELMNNRVSSDELEQRLVRGISEPLLEIGDLMMPPLAEQLAGLETAYAAAPAEIAESLAQAEGRGDEVVVAMKAVLDRMLEFEDYNELVDLLRTIVDEQQQLNERTKQKQKTELRSLLE